MINEPMPSSEIIQEKISEIFSLPEFRLPKRSLKDIILDWIIRLLEKLDIHTEGLSFGEGLFIFIITALIIAAIIFLVVVLSSKLFGKNVSLSVNGKSVVHNRNIDTMEKARKAAKDGNYSLGIRWLFISLLLSLNEQGYIKISEYKTNRQYVYELKKNNYSKLKLFESLVKDFNEIRYGDKKSGQEGYNYWESCVVKLAGGGDSH